LRVLRSFIPPKKKQSDGDIDNEQDKESADSEHSPSRAKISTPVKNMAASKSGTTESVNNSSLEEKTSPLTKKTSTRLRARRQE